MPLQFRIHAEPDLAGLYSHEFSDESKWRAYRMEALRSEEFAVGYVERDGAFDRELLQLWHDNRRRKVAMVLELERPVGIEAPRAFVIRDLVSEHWMVFE